MSDFLTIRECADELRVSPEVIRRACIRWRDGEAGGLPYCHAGAKPEDKSGRVNYRVRRDKWEEFKRDRAREESREDRRVRAWVEQPISYV